MIVSGDFEGGVFSTVLTCPLQQLEKESLAQALAAMAGIDSNNGDMQLIHHKPATGDPQQVRAIGQAEADASVIRQFRAPLVGIPEATEGRMIEHQTGLQPARIQQDRSHGRTNAHGSIPTLHQFAGIL